MALGWLSSFTVLFVAALLALLVGMSLGLLGGGGSILTLPLLVYVVGVEPKSAIATSLLVVGFTSATALVPHARARRVRWRIGGFFGAAGMAGAYAGGVAGRSVAPSLLLAGFGVVMLAASFAMMRPRPEPDLAQPVAHVPVTKVLAVGALVGVVAGLLGAGGGFLIVPALVVLTGLGIAEAIGTSLLVITMQSVAGFVGNIGHVAVDTSVALVVTLAAVAGSLVGARLSTRISASSLRRGFAWFVLALGVLFVVKQMPSAAHDWLALHPAGWALVVAAIGALLLGALRVRRSDQEPKEAFR